MAEERNTENFALGLIVAAIVFLLLRREWGKGRETERGAEVQPVLAAPSCCGVLIEQAPSTNPGVSIGGESYSLLPFKQSSVTPFMKNSPTPGKQWVIH
jgi:hypothetical protein